MSINLHSIVRSVISSIHEDISGTLFRSTGNYEEDERGDPVQVFAEGIPVTLQIQTMGSDVIQHVDDISIASSLRKIYIHSSEEAKYRLWSMWRPSDRSGDYLYDSLGRWWKINAVIEDFTRAGWVSVQAQMQTVEPIFRIAYEDEDCGCSFQM